VSPDVFNRIADTKATMFCDLYCLNSARVGIVMRRVINGVITPAFGFHFGFLVCLGSYAGILASQLNFVNHQFLSRLAILQLHLVHGLGLFNLCVILELGSI